MTRPAPTRSLSIARRLGLGFAAVLVCTLAIAAWGQFALAQQGDRMQDIAGARAEKSRLYNGMLASLSAAGIQGRSVAMLNEIDVEASTAQAKELERSLARYDQLAGQIPPLLERPGTDARERDLFGEVQALSAKARPELLDAVRAAADGDTVRASLGLMTQLAPAETAWRGKLAELVTLQDTLNDAAAADARTTAQQARWGSGALLAAAIALGGFIAWRTTRSITAPIGRAVVVAERIALGDLTSRVEVRIHDETGRLLEAIAAMQERLRSLVGDIGHAASTVHHASAEVAAGNMDLSHRTEQTAYDLQAAAAALAELTGAVSESTDAARQAERLTSSASAVATRGGEVVSEVVRTMDTISASSRKIADITGVIDGIAFQTNILALNAAVEAARAGEQGRGFAVVAGEVRSLAQRSAEAAKEIKTLITASSSHVQQGGTLVAQAGTTIAELVQSVQKVSGIMGGITQAAQSQGQRIADVSASVGALETMTQQNAALVEQGTAASDSLRDQAARLAGTVGAFRLERGTEAANAQLVAPAALPALTA